MEESAAKVSLILLAAVSLSIVVDDQKRNERAQETAGDQLSCEGSLSCFQKSPTQLFISFFFLRFCLGSSQF